MAQFDRITFDPQIMGGRACIRGMRIPVSVIVKQIAHGATHDEVLAAYPDLQPQDVQQAIEYAAMVVGFLPTPNDAGPVGAVSQWYEVDIVEAPQAVGMYAGLRPRDARDDDAESEHVK